MPACRTLDCVSIFALTVDDAWAALAAIAGPDAADPYSRAAPARRAWRRAARGCGSACRCPGQRMFFGDRASAAAFDARARAACAQLGATIVEIDIEPFYETARLLYDGPWVAERYVAIRALLASIAGRRSIR